MALAVGARLGPYEIVAPLGAGGMGEVYRARDTRLGREVALKILSPTFALDRDRAERFQREAQILAAINHPHIGAIFGIEESNDERALVLELVEGPTLAARIAQGPLPLAEVCQVARQICEALDAAHQQGIVHRDLKPANIKIRPDGVVKVLDFGLAQIPFPEQVTGFDPTSAPTVTIPAVTQAGAIVGTPAYMSPGQATGRPADKRDDVWAFGSVLYEMLTGTRAFPGEDVADTLAAVLSGTPDWTSLPPDLPDSIHTLVTGCLERDRQKRIDDFSIVLFLLREPAMVLSTRRARQPTVVSGPPAAPAVEARLRRGTILLCLAIAFGIIALRAPFSMLAPASLILAALGAGNLIYYFIVRSRTRIRV